MSKKRILVISDLHLGGAAGEDGQSGFQMCSARGQQQLAEFFDWATAQARTDPRDLHLVIAGDIVDFLAEETWSPLTLDEGQAVTKLEAIFGRTPDVWRALGRFTASGAQLVLLLGNHDVELSLPKVRQRLMRELGPGRIEFLYDNQALTYGPVLIEHGNRYDKWNAVFHDSLRRTRSALSRGLPARDVPVQPGSALVCSVMNPIKNQYAFVDLLKPERAGVLPLLAYLNPEGWLHHSKGIKQLLRVAVNRHDERGEPRDPDQIASDAEIPFADAQMFDLADAVAQGRDPDHIGVETAHMPPPLLERVKAWFGGQVDAKELALLHRVLRGLADRHELTFQIDVEEAEYRVPAQERAKAFKLVVFGHTHLVKRVDLGGGAQYLNTGTWADLMRLPDAVFVPGDSGLEQLRSLLRDIAQNHLDPWRVSVPTFADLRLSDGGDAIERGDVWYFDAPNPPTRVEPGSLGQRLSR